MNQKVSEVPTCRFLAIVYSVLLLASPAYPSRCEQLKSQPKVWVTKEVDALVRAAYTAYKSDNAIPAYERVLDRIAGTIHKCKLSEDTDFISRYQRFADYIQAASLDRQPDHELGFTVSDEQYFAETYQYVQIPQFLLGQTFLRSVSRFETLEGAKSFLRQLNSNRKPSEQLIFFSYKSRHLGTPDNDKSYRRLLIVVPGDLEKGEPEKWVQFGIADPGAHGHVRNVSIVSALPGPNGTFNAYFKDYYRSYHRDGSISIKGRWELGEGDDNCAQCHKTGVLPIFPVKGSVVETEQQFVRAVNERLLAYGSPRFDKYMDERKFGPGISSATLDDRRRRFGAAFDTTVAAQSMTCASCHQHERIGALNWPMDRVVISSFIKGGEMPLGFKLKVSERHELYTKLIQEYFASDKTNPGILKSWLLSPALRDGDQ